MCFYAEQLDTNRPLHLLLTRKLFLRQQSNGYIATNELSSFVGINLRLLFCLCS